MKSGLEEEKIYEIVLSALSNANLTRPDDDQLAVSRAAPIFGTKSKLDSIGLVGLLIDVEEELHSAGCNISLNDERTMSEKHSPFQTVDTLVRFIRMRIEENLENNKKCQSECS